MPTFFILNVLWAAMIACGVTIALLVRSVPGGADCPGNPEFPIDVGIGERLGSRALFGGSTTPPSPRS